MKLLKKSISNTLLFFTFLIIIFSCNSNSQTAKTINENQLFKQDELESIYGIYEFKNNDIELKIEIKNNYWSGTTKIITGTGDAYDKENIQYDNGITKGNDLYEKEGFIKIGNVDGNNLMTTIGGQKVILNKIDIYRIK